MWHKLQETLNCIRDCRSSFMPIVERIIRGHKQLKQMRNASLHFVLNHLQALLVSGSEDYYDFLIIKNFIYRFFPPPLFIILLFFFNDDPRHLQRKL